MTGVLNIYKEKGYTSHDVVAIIRKIAGTKKVGHTGTLDPDATGVLPVCLGRATKFANYLASEDKTYIAEVILGVETNTGDISGEIIAERAVKYDENEIARAVRSFNFDKRGVYMQIPPMFSAIKIGGKKLYELARKGETIDIPPRPVIIHHSRVLNFLPKKNAFTIEVKCSKGTYIRSLAADIGIMLGCGATMGELVRTQSGTFTINNAMKLDCVKKAAEEKRLAEFILPVDELLPFPKIFVTGDNLKCALNGNSLPFSVLDEHMKIASNDEFTGSNSASANKNGEEKFWICSHERIIGLYVSNSKKIRPEVMM